MLEDDRCRHWCDWCDGSDEARYGDPDAEADDPAELWSVLDYVGGELISLAEMVSSIPSGGKWEFSHTRMIYLSAAELMLHRKIPTHVIVGTLRMLHEASELEAIYNEL